MSETTTASLADIPSDMSLDDFHDSLEGESTEKPETDTDQEALATPEPEVEETDPDERKIKLKINGKTVEKAESEVIKMAQLYSATNIKLEQAKVEANKAKEMQGQVTQQQEAIKSILQVLQRGDIATIADFVAEHLNAGPQFEQSVIQYALKLYEMSRMSPAERELIDHKKQLAKFQRDAEERQKADADRSYQMRVNQWSEYLNAELPKAMTTVGLPDNEFIRQQIVQTWQAALANGQTPTAAAVAGYVKQQLEAANIRLSMPPATPGRPRATAASVAAGQKSNGALKPQSEGYIAFSDYQKNRRY